MNLMISRREMILLVSVATLEIGGRWNSQVHGAEKDLRKAFKKFSRKEELDPLKNVGEAYLQANPSASGVDALLQGLPSGKTLDEDYWASIEKQIQNDYRNGKCTTVNSWILSNTECNLCALLHLVGA